MKKSLKTRLVLTVGMVLSYACFMLAHAGVYQSNPEVEATKRTKTFTRVLQLTEEQQPKIKEIFSTFFSKMEATKAADISAEDRKTAVRQHVKERETNLKNTLTEEQWNKLLELRKKEKGK